MKRALAKGLTACYTLLVSFALPAQEAVDFKLNPEVGKPLPFNLQIKTDVEGSHDLIMDMNMKMVAVPIQNENGNFTIEQTIAAIQVDMNAGMMTMSYDSEETPTEKTTKILAEQFSKILNKKVSSVVSEKGEMIHMDLPPGFKPEGFDTNSFSNIFPVLPEGPVVPGDSWSGVSEIKENPFISQIVTVTTYREKSPEGYIIDISGTIKDDTGNDIGRMDGNYTLDEETYFTKSSSIKTTMEMQGTKIVNEREVTLEIPSSKL